MPDSIVVWLPHLVKRYLTNRGRKGHRHVVSTNIDPFSIQLAAADEFQRAYRVRLVGRTHELRAWRGRLYRRALDPLGCPASLEQFEKLEGWSLSRSDQDAIFWPDHPGAWDQDLLPPEDPFRRAPLVQVASNFWRPDPADEEQARSRMERGLLNFLVADGKLWRRTSAPGLSLSLRTGNVEAWVDGIPPYPTKAIHLDHHERHLIIDLLVSRGIRPEDSESYRYAQTTTRGTSDLVTEAADCRMLEIVLAAIVAVARPTIAALGSDLAVAYWSGRAALEEGTATAARHWYFEHSSRLSRSNLPAVMSASALFAARVDLTSRQFRFQSD